MASGKANYFSEALLKQIFRGQSYSFPGTLYLALTTASIAASGTGSTLPEPSGNGYGRLSVTASTANFSDPGSGTSTSNNNTLTFATATGSWGTITSVAICDSSSGGQVLYFGDLTSSKTVGTNDVFQFTATNLSISEQ